MAPRWWSTPRREDIAGDWNFGLRATGARYVTLAHQDDTYAQRFLEQTLAAFRRQRRRAVLHRLSGDRRSREAEELQGQHGQAPDRTADPGRTTRRSGVAAARLPVVRQSAAVFFGHLRHGQVGGVRLPRRLRQQSRLGRLVAADGGGRDLPAGSSATRGSAAQPLDRHGAIPAGRYESQGGSDHVPPRLAASAGDLIALAYRAGY